jgi:serine/threonine-protein kinase
VKICSLCSELYPDDASFCPADGKELKKSTDPFLGRTIAARYRLIKRLGSGGMAMVYLARHVIIERLSAIKLLRQDLGLNPLNRERFLREARAVNRINHKNIVEITDYGEADGVAYLVMEYVEGESLLAHLRKTLFDWPRAANVAIQIASALGRAHQTGVIHRDLKPENVILVPETSRPGEPRVAELVKLTDFGIAKIVDAPALTFSEQLFGTPGYIAPEYVEGIAADGRADLYSLGVLLYEMVTGFLPYEARTQAEMLLKPLTASPIPPGTRVNGLPPELESLLLRMLSRSADHRPHDAFAVVDALNDVLRRYANPSVKPPVAQVAQIAEASEPRRPTPPPEGSRHASPPSSLTGSTANVGGMKTSEIASRWSGALAEIEASIAQAREKGAPAPVLARATALAAVARDMVPRLERASRVVADAQSRVDRLEAHGREFRANLGHAIDELVRDRSRERAHVEAVSARKDYMEGNGPTSQPLSQNEMRIWESAALGAELDRAVEAERDLAFQIDTLQQQLDAKNEAFDRDMIEGAGALEGSLSALRKMTNELMRTMDEAASVLSGQG